MDALRYRQLMNGVGKLTEEEKTKGWHFCPDCDGMLIGPGTPEWDGCQCRTGQCSTCGD